MISMNKSLNRQRELDFLRGIAIILVILRHQYIDYYTHNMGWIGVDLFFVLSGFLVSGLLFREYNRYGNIKPANFLIRRGFKIYPIYYIFYIPYLIVILKDHSFVLRLFLSDMFFVQNYYNVWGWAFIPSWSLAIEEHFYFALAIVMSYGVNNKRIILNSGEKGYIRMDWAILCIMLICLGMRIWYNHSHPDSTGQAFTLTHLRIDSLLAGVLVSYLYYFKREYLNLMFQKTKQMFFPLILLLVSFTPFMDPRTSIFERTIGFTMLYIAFGLLLIYFLLTEDINQKLNKVFTKPLVDWISKIGISSYSIYIIHSFILQRVYRNLVEPNIVTNKYILFSIVFGLSILTGDLMTRYVEKFFLDIRDKYYPNRLASNKSLKPLST